MLVGQEAREVLPSYQFTVLFPEHPVVQMVHIHLLCMVMDSILVIPDIDVAFTVPKEIKFTAPMSGQAARHEWLAVLQYGHTKLVAIRQQCIFKNLIGIWHLSGVQGHGRITHHTNQFQVRVVMLMEEMIWRWMVMVLILGDRIIGADGMHLMETKYIHHT